jgi:hypothetical protein
MSGTVNRSHVARQCRDAAELQSLLVPGFQTMVPSGFSCCSATASPRRPGGQIRPVPWIATGTWAVTAMMKTPSLNSPMVPSGEIPGSLVL